jgi:hypothetical protein
MKANTDHQRARPSWRYIQVSLCVMVFCPSLGLAQTGPEPPCGRTPTPAYPAVGDAAIVQSWSRAQFGQDWTPPACTGWTTPGFTTLVTTVARFHAVETEGLLRHIGAISELRGMRYWSTTHKQWRILIEDAYALTDAQRGQRRHDFAPEEMRGGKMLYFQQVDNLSGKAIYRMRMADSAADRLVVTVENVTIMRYLFLPALYPGDMQSVYFFDRESENDWRYYGIVRTGVKASRLIAGNDASAINRAVAFYRYFVGIPTDQEPPAAR